MTPDPSLALGCRVLGTFVFANAAVGKIRYRHELTGVVDNYRLLPEGLAAPVAWTIVGLEILTALSLATGVRPAAGAGLGIGLFYAFALAIGINLGRGRREIDCGCFQSGLHQVLSAGLIVRNLLLSVALAPLFFTVPPLVRPLQWIDGLGVGLVAYLIYRVFDQLLSLHHSSMQLRKRFV